LSVANDEAVTVAEKTADDEPLALCIALGLALALLLPLKVEYIHAHSGSNAAPALAVTLGLALVDAVDATEVVSVPLGDTLVEGDAVPHDDDDAVTELLDERETVALVE
jgi:hypothetical protein